MLFADDPGTLFTLQVEEAGSGDPQRILEVAGQLCFQARPQDVIEKDIQPLTLPPAVHIALAKTQRALLQDAFKKIGMFNL
ncbi:hypothetical protein D3C76_1312600 [compost metagenome]